MEAILRPRLDPMMGSTVLAARVAVQLTKLVFESDFGEGKSASECAKLAQYRVMPTGMAMVRLALHSLSVYLDLKWSASQWLSAVLEAAHFGHCFRRCFFFDYKENRSPYPRVTNRGVQVPSGRKASKRKGSYRLE